MKKVILLIISLLGGINTYSEEPPKYTPPSGFDIPKIELFIDYHKKKHDLLKQRLAKDASLNLLLEKSKQTTKEFKELYENLNSRFLTIMDYVELGTYSLSILKSAQSTLDLLNQYNSYINTIKYPEIAKHYIITIRELRTEINDCKKYISVLSFKGTADQKMETLRQISDMIYQINETLRGGLLFIKGLNFIRREIAPPRTIDKIKIANDIIRSFQKK